ncbi:MULTISPECIES: alpha/beta fold hydrolase [unclassified Pseudomonas]|uniref:alpha/beta fold hydrolase n=1 Tax=unclassified Pseudomonas TaxID=196821 RepID=UPI000BC91958|nr:MULTISPECIES: alpha/beta fold hydrolase [unclassified Pseudomonas]PVZ13608.1 alpha/beta hydrolase family protein [Pseudomonas sp. URIL14HWK12:I12]PVZ23914.1 alpha/beta hydrolase family protein [Pseudomonas sp. URIL14HWK12:I10]PVZ33447.1 alpha/beta hydrolase family protein [Pseudomonas sp. URIL14HWK12:I11]SNZ11591.1 Lysophospholipase [Pseudomonas sp. URIL14HWK12:I9]
MQSSSTLFPVALASAERRGDLSEDVYLVKANNSLDFTTELAVTRLGLCAPRAGRGPAVVLLHGAFSNRRFWYSPSGLGLGPALARAGYDVWIPEMRGHGLSPRNQGYASNRVDDYARYDLPAINAFVSEMNGRRPHWVGHSLGGTTLAMALGLGSLTHEHIASAALFGSQVSRCRGAMRWWPINWLLRTALRRFDHISGRRFKRGPEDEPTGVAVELLRGYRKPGPWWAALADSQVPLLAVAGAGDLQDPAWACRALFEQAGGEPRLFVELSQAAGYTRDFGHVEMLLGEAAEQEVWPLLERWLRQADDIGHKSHAA